MEIQGLRIADLRNFAHLQFHENTKVLIDEAGAGTGGLNIELLFQMYLAAIVREDDVLKKIVKSKFTEKIREADRKRDAIYSTITTIINSLLNHYDELVREAARDLKIIIDTYGNINKKSYDEQTSAVSNILQDFRNGGNAGHIVVVGVSDMVAELERTNNLVRDLMKARLDEASIKSEDTMRAARIETDEAYLAIRKRINAAIIMEGTENYAEFVRKQNLNIDRYKLLLAKAKGKKKPGGEDESEEEVEDEN